MNNGDNFTTLLTKREYFAAMAMQGILANLANLETIGWNYNTVSINAVEQADSLLKELED